MQLREGEAVLKTVSRHPTPYFLKLAEVIAIAIPFYVLIFYIGREASAEVTLGLLAFISFFIGIIIAVFSFDYLLDKLIITNKRVIWVNWRSLFKREEHEAELMDIQDIGTSEKGILSKLRFLDYGFIKIDTASASACIDFQDCPDPEGTKHFIIGKMEHMYSTFHKKRENPPPVETEKWPVN